jgi:hypothetical protein
LDIVSDEMFPLTRVYRGLSLVKKARLVSGTKLIFHVTHVHKAGVCGSGFKSNVDLKPKLNGASIDFFEMDRGI